MAEAGAARTVPIGVGPRSPASCAGAGPCGAATPKAVDRTDQLLLLAEEAEIQGLKDLRDGQRWPVFAEVCATCGFVHWFSSEAVKRRTQTS